MTPYPFFQCAIIMIYDCETELNIAFTFISGKKICCKVLHQLMILMEYIRMLSTITTDFAMALISAEKKSSRRVQS
ncbi:hypothetical protein MXB_5228 [Myxobolus squamalis]|nr:hypothetical protein MXB_5228 [Myxobolus squamalis]